MIIINVLMEGYSCLVKIMSCFLLLDRQFSRQIKHRGWVVIIASFVLAVSNAAMFMLKIQGFINIEFFLNTVAVGVMARYLFEVRLIEIISSAWFYLVIFQLADFFLWTILTSFLNKQVINKTIFISTYQFLFSVLLFLSLYILKKITYKGNTQYQEWKFKFLYAVIGSAAILFFQRVYLKKTAHYVLMAWEGFFLYELFLLLIFLKYASWQKKQQKYEMIELKNKMLEKNYNDMLNNYNENLRLFHDFYAHMNVILNYVQMNENKKCEAYIEEILKSKEKLRKHVWTGNEIMDLILNDRCCEAEKKGLQIHIEADTVGTVQISDMDLCTIFSNLINNALENCPAGQEAVRVYIKRRQEFLIVIVHNQVEEKSVIRNGSPVTKKTNRRLHGIGLDSVSCAVHKNDGSIEYSIQDHSFEVIVTIPL